MVWFFGREACGILAPRPGIEPAPPALEGKSQPLNHQGSLSLVIFWLNFSMIPITE